MTSYIIAFPFVLFSPCPFQFDYLENKMGFLDEIKNIFHTQALNKVRSHLKIMSGENCQFFVLFLFSITLCPSPSSTFCATTKKRQIFSKGIYVENGVLLFNKVVAHLMSLLYVLNRRRWFIT